MALHANGDRLKFAYSEQDVDPYAAPAGGTNASPLDTGKPAQPRVAGFGGVSVPRLIAESRVDPLRSTRARLERVAGIVTLEIVVQKDGSVREAVALSAEPDGYDFGASAVEAVRQWRFEPAVFEGRPVDAVLNLTIEVKQDPPPPAGD